MINKIAFLNRQLACFFMKFNITYYCGMVFIRLGRFFRKSTFKSGKNNEFYTIKMFNDVKIKVDRYSYMGGCIFWSGFHHTNEILYLKNFLTPDMTFVDVGANQGEFSLIAASILKNGQVLAFEPVKYQRNLLLDNKSKNTFDNLEIYPFGLGDKKGNLPIYTSNSTIEHHGIHEGLSSLYNGSDRTEFQENVEINVFDDIFYTKISRLDFIKIDIEGAELYALIGMVESIKKFKPTILIEINDRTFKAAGYRTQELLIFFNGLNYDFFQIKKGQLVDIPVKEFETWGNYIAKHCSH